MNRFVRLALLPILVLFSQAAFAQFESASVLGTVRDPSGGVVVGATIALRNMETGITTTTATDESGNYLILNVKNGTYTVRAEMQGFSAAVAENVKVTVNARQRVDLSLQVGNITESVVVTGAAALVETDSSDRGTVVASEQIVNLPLNGRAYADLALLSPGGGRSPTRSTRTPLSGIRRSTSRGSGAA